MRSKNLPNINFCQFDILLFQTQEAQRFTYVSFAVVFLFFYECSWLLSQPKIHAYFNSPSVSVVTISSLPPMLTCLLWDLALYSSSLAPSSCSLNWPFSFNFTISRSEQFLFSVPIPDELLERISLHSMCLHPHHTRCFLQIWFQHLLF